MDDDLMQRLLLAETDLLDALQGGPQMLASYCQRLSALPNVLSTARKNGNVGTETLSLANSIASRISNIAGCFLDIRLAEKRTMTQLQSDCDAMMERMGSLTLNSDDTSGLPPSAYPIKSTPNVESSSPPFLTYAYRWLLDNLHNPYPTAEVKSQFASASASQVSSISSWFTNARRRIGWTSLCREHFSNCRAEMIDAAYRALVEEDPHRMLSPEVRHSFVAMKVAAEGLYSSTFARSTFAGDLDGLVDDTIEEVKKLTEVGECHQVEQANLMKTVQDSYPSPDRSIAPSPVPALGASVTDEGTGKGDVAPPTIVGSKRRRPSIEPVDQRPSTTSRPMKRLRASVPSPTCLPSPPSSTNGIDVPSDDSPSEHPSMHSMQSETNNVLLPLPRCLSDADSTGIPEPPYSSMVPPRLDTVWDPLLRSSMENDLIDDWLRTNSNDLFAFPLPVGGTVPDSSLSCEVDLFRDYSLLENIPMPIPAQTADSHTSAAIDFSDFDSLLQSIGNTFPAPMGTIPPSDIDDGAHITLDSLTRDMLQSDLDWTSLFDGPDTYQPTFSTSPQYPTDMQSLFDIDFAALRIPPVIPCVDSQGDFASNQVRLQQLHAMQEAVRQMEQELQSEGVLM